MADDTDRANDNVKRLPVKFKQPVPEDRTLLLPWEVKQSGKCTHLRVGYIIDSASAEVECNQCGEKLNPMWVLSQLATEDRRYADSQKRYREEMERLTNRSRTKCQHCGKLTRISYK